ncbi:ribonuclease P protein component [Nocardioides okcheonensis]|uniref:ribonuclease P protein component n=1 Tax=Nocardioides okcheonensis TaxID=2894081 RepID=UPI001E598DF4|nr:ribonuclease P protein component [Nocardioides okcheonensis]UFN43004.1 ribonuclease P protein component [Nocardioides okcheonensis]
MLPPAHRLTDSDGFRRAVRGGRRAGSSTLVVHLWVDPDGVAGPVEVGFTVSKAVGNAATRNRVKRRLRHLTREHLPSLEELPGRAALVVRALPAAAGASYDALAADLGRSLERVSRA